MKTHHVSLNNHSVTFNNYDSIKNHYQGAFIDNALASFLILLLSPIYIINIVAALITNTNPFSYQYKVDALGRRVRLRSFSLGLFKPTALLIDIAFGELGFCGAPLTHNVPLSIQFSILNQIKVKPGLFSLYDLHLKTGLSITNKEELLEQQLNGSVKSYLLLLIKSAACLVLYGNGSNQLKSPVSLALFGLNVKNTSMDDAVNWIVSKDTLMAETKIGFFINAHSVNLSIENHSFYEELTNADAIFADGSGIRLAARKAGYLLNSNNNGTDMLPHLCRECSQTDKSLYLYGAKPGVAKKASNSLLRDFPSLKIAGTEHGYTPLSNDELVKQINDSNCDILLVGMGSPIQESWLLKNKGKLKCQTALAVGGLFDFYSDSISRAPLWLRELGMEWVWRLLQEPKVKFHRYVIGTPVFLYRTLILNMATKGVK